MADGNGADLLNYVAIQELPTPFILFTNSIDPALQHIPPNFLGTISKFDQEGFLKVIISLISKK